MPCQVQAQHPPRPKIHPGNFTVSGKITFEDASRAVRNRQRQDDEEGPGQKGARPPAKITLPRLNFLERPMPAWEEPPKPARRRGKAG
jgi:hypothetical protein